MPNSNTKFWWKEQIYSWVNGHQDSNSLHQILSCIKQLNVLKDKAADDAYNLNYKWMGNAYVPVLTGEKLGVYLEDKKLTSDLWNDLLQYFQKENLINYVH